MRRTGRTPIDDDAEKTEIRPLEASIPLSIIGNYLYYEARLDGLTGLFGRRQFFQMGEELLGNMRYEQKDKMGCFFILDIDSFKEINDKYGHPAGDRILRETAGKLKEVFENKGIIGRLGGDEFVALIHHPMSRAEIEKLLNQLREELKELKAGAVTCSIGVIPVEKQYTVEELYRSADRVLYEAKKMGKDQFVFGYHFPAKTSGRLSVFQGGGKRKPPERSRMSGEGKNNAKGGR